MACVIIQMRIILKDFQFNLTIFLINNGDFKEFYGKINLKNKKIINACC